MFSKREAILLGSVAVAAAYGVYTFAFAPKRAPGAGATASASTPAQPMVREIAQIQQEIGRTTVSPLIRLAAVRAGEEWSTTLFLWAPLPSELMAREAARQQQQQASQTAAQEAEASRKAVAEQERLRVAERQRRFSYTGYVCSADRMFAVINGAVYAVGDRLDGLADCVLQTVTPESVTIDDRVTATTVQVPMLQATLRERPATTPNDKP